MGMREVRRAARRALHTAMSEDIMYAEVSGNRDIEEIIAVPVRLHISSEGAVGAPGRDYAELYDFEPRVVFMREDITPRRGDLVITYDRGVYRINAVRPPHDITVTAEVGAISDEEIINFGGNPDEEYSGFELS